MSLKITKAGILDTLQDRGRYGYQHLGINPGGAMDKFAMEVANALVGNEKWEAVLECYFPAPIIEFTEDTVFAISGANFSPHVNDVKAAVLHPVAVKKGMRLQFKKWKQGNCCYIAIRGGFKTDPWMGSSSTNLKLAWGGYRGRTLQNEDLLESNHPIPFNRLSVNEPVTVLGWSAAGLVPDDSPEIYVVKGPEWDWMEEASQEKFDQKEFIISGSSDRMGYRLEGNDLKKQTDKELISSAVFFGTIQLLPNGQLIALMADHQTTGGYPRVAQVIMAHHGKLAQKQPGQKIRFQFVDDITAENMYLKQQFDLRQLQNACILKFDER